MFAVIGQKIYEKLRNSLDLLQAQGEYIGAEVVSNTEPFTNTNGWFSTPTPPRYVTATSGVLLFTSTDPTIDGMLSSSIFLNSGGTYVCEYSLDSPFKNQVMIGISPYGSSIYAGPIEQSGDIKRSFRFTVGSGGYMFLSFVAFSDTAQASILRSITIKAVDTKAKISPVIIPQGTVYPATTYEIRNVSNFMSKGSSLNSCDVSVNISCFADKYATTYNQAKAVVDALDLYEVTYTEDGQSYTAKFRFENLDDEYFKTPEKFYKNLTFNCLIIKN